MRGPPVSLYLCDRGSFMEICIKIDSRLFKDTFDSSFHRDNFGLDNEIMTVSVT